MPCLSEEAGRFGPHQKESQFHFARPTPPKAL
jgi:hypothetical protein